MSSNTTNVNTITAIITITINITTIIDITTIITTITIHYSHSHQDALRVRKGDFDNIVEDVSDDEGDEEAGEVARAEQVGINKYDLWSKFDICIVLSLLLCV